MKILLVTTFFKPSWETGGVTRASYDISKRLIERGHELTVYTTNQSRFKTNVETNKAVYLEGMKVYYFENLRKYFPRKKIPPIPYYLPLIARKEIKNFDIIHIHEYRRLLTVIIHHYAKEYKVPYVLQAHGTVLPTFGKQLLKKLFDLVWGYKILKDATKVIALTKTEAEQYKKMGVDENKIEIIPNGIDFSQYKNLPSKGSFKKKYGIEDNKKIVLYLARIHWIKGPDILLKAFALLKKNVDLNNVILVLAGPDSGFLSTVKSLVARLKLNESIILTGPLYGTDKLAAYIDADIYAFPSRYEIFGISLLEACACGAPVVASRTGGTSELVVDGVIGTLFKPCDVKQLEHAIATLLNDNRAREMGLRAKHYVEKNFSIEKIVDRLESLYDMVVFDRVK